MIKLIPLLAFTLLAGVLPKTTAAAGFDCRKAATLREKAVCADPGLSAQDEELNTAYAAALQGLSRPATAQMVNNQRTWLGYIQKLCTADLARADTACLKAQYANRIEILKLSKPQDGLRFYTHDTYLIKADPKKDNSVWWNMTTVAAAYPMMDGHPDLAFNRFAEGLSVDTPTTGYSRDYTRFVSVEQVYPHVIVLEKRFGNHDHGAVSTPPAPLYAYYLRDQERGLSVNDIFTDRAPLADLIAKELGTGKASSYSAAEFLSRHIEYWRMDATGIRFRVPVQFTASAADDTQSVFMPWAKLKPYVRPDAEWLFSRG